MLGASLIVALVCPYAMRTAIFGLFAGLFNLGVSLAPLPDAIRVAQTGALEDFPLAITLASFFSSLFWAQYSVLIDDGFYLAPNLIGALVGAVELILIYWVMYGGGVPGAQSLLESGSQPLMPRARGQKFGGKCSNILNIFGLSAASLASKCCQSTHEVSSRKGGEFGLDDVKARLYDKTRFGTFAQAAPNSGARSGAESGCSRKSPFSPFDNTEGAESPQHWRHNRSAADEPRDEFAFIDGQTYRPYSGAALGGPGRATYLNLGISGGIDCIL